MFKERKQFVAGEHSFLTLHFFSLNVCNFFIFVSIGWITTIEYKVQQSEKCALLDQKKDRKVNKTGVKIGIEAGKEKKPEIHSPGKLMF